MKWKGFSHEENTWEKPKGISSELVIDFEILIKVRKILCVPLLDIFINRLNFNLFSTTTN